MDECHALGHVEEDGNERYTHQEQESIQARFKHQEGSFEVQKEVRYSEPIYRPQDHEGADCPVLGARSTTSKRARDLG